MPANREKTLRNIAVPVDDYFVCTIKRGCRSTVDIFVDKETLDGPIGDKRWSCIAGVVKEIGHWNHLHRDITDAPPRAYVKFLNGNRFDFRKSNLFLPIKRVYNHRSKIWYSVADNVTFAGNLAYIRCVMHKGPKAGKEAEIVLDADNAKRIIKNDMKIGVWYASKNYYANIKGDDDRMTDTSMSLSRWVMELGKFRPGGRVVDHINGDTLLNTRTNLRAVTVRQNIINRVNVGSNNKSGVNGVCSRVINGQLTWWSYINIDKKQKKFGPFVTLTEAANSRRALELKHYGEFAPIKQARNDK
jgi:hypothetical protein